jgi:hypothetical protein
MLSSLRRRSRHARAPRLNGIQLIRVLETFHQLREAIGGWLGNFVLRQEHSADRSADDAVAGTELSL